MTLQIGIIQHDFTIHICFHDTIAGRNATYMAWEVQRMIHSAAHFAAWVLNTWWTMAIMGWSLVFVPILGMWAVHKYGWEHWEPFAKHHK